MGRKQEAEPEYNCTVIGPTPGPPLKMLITVAPDDVVKFHEWLDRDPVGNMYSLVALQQGWRMTFTKLPGGGLSVTTQEINKP